jgi:hypothetical protein
MNKTTYTRYEQGVCDLPLEFAKQMALSYEKAPLLYDQNNITPDSSIEVASFYNDNLAYYYSQYKHVRSIKTEDFGNLAPHMYFIKLMEESSAKDYYVFNSEDLPYIKAEAGVEIYKLINGKISSSEAFDVIYQNYLNLVNKGLEELQSYDLYLEHFDSYKTSLCALYRLEFVSLIIAFISCYLLIIIAPQYIFGNGLTLGRFIMKTRICFAKENYAFVILRQFLELLSSIVLILIIGFFTYGVYIFLLPVGFTSVLGILSIFLTFTIVNIGCSLFTNNKVLLSELLSKSITVNIKEPKYSELEETNKKEEINE